MFENGVEMEVKKGLCVKSSVEWVQYGVAIIKMKVEGGFVVSAGTRCG